LGAGFVPVRKPGKLPCKVFSQKYELEYGEDEVQIHADAIKRGERTLVVDDLLATGGTVSAILKLLERLGAKVVGVRFIVELSFLEGRKRFPQYDVFSLIKY
jgi:adenine phosphoribosyltransferase